VLDVKVGAAGFKLAGAAEADVEDSAAEATGVSPIREFIMKGGLYRK